MLNFEKDHTSNHGIKTYQAILEFTIVVAASTFLKMTDPVVFRRLSFA
jgi:hypothetical protein